MPSLVYIHGFLSSPQSAKAQQTASWVRRHRPDWQFVCPALSAYPEQAHKQLRAAVAGCDPRQPIYAIGSSLGGFWATGLTEQWGIKSVLVNPAVSPHTRFTSWIGQTLSNYHTGEQYVLDESDLAYLAQQDCAQVAQLDRYWLMVQTGDETLNYRQAVERYRGCRQTVQAGGDHAFVGYEDWLPDIAEFFEAS